ncbi:2-hydroxyacid dehydrogenase [Paraburkholderia sediminicola]|uniref:2-hydroxyacid dehydrogenase n=1 Tax=Paraburkholderia sediminicola TaxID=458836 RepID=UPI0038B7041C
MKAVLQYAASEGFRRRLIETQPEWLDIVVLDGADARQARAQLEDADVLLHVLAPVTTDVLRSAPRLKLVQKIGVGINTIDVETAKSLGIAVANMPGTNSQAVAEHTLALMLGALRRIVYFDGIFRQGDGWNIPPDTFDTVSEISGRVVGFVGYGAVPQRLATALTALGAQVVFYTQGDSPDGPARRLPTLEALLEQSDIVSLHVPLTAETASLLDAKTFGLMKAGSVLVNTARGELVDEHALVEALRSGRLAAAGLDVFAAEPVRPDNPLLSLPNVVVTPHIAWLTPQTLERSIKVIMENCRRLKEGEPLLHRV